MTNHVEQNIAARMERWRRFFDMDVPSRGLFLVRYVEGAPERPPLHPERKQERIEWAWRQYERHLGQAQWLDDDFVPYLDVVTGTEIFAEAFGCRVHRPHDDLPFARPLVERASEAARISVPDLGSTPLVLLFEIADELRRRAGNGALLKIVDIQSPMDISALIWDKNTFYSAILESPEAVKELAEKVTQLLAAFLDEWFSRYGEAFVAHYPDYYMPRGITLSEDEVGAVSEEMFVEFFLPELAGLSERYGGIGMHCCANARHQWTNFMKIPNLRLLNLVRPPEEVRDACSFFADHVAQMHSWAGDGDPLSWPRQHPPGAHIVFEVPADTKEKAIALAAGLREACG